MLKKILCFVLLLLMVKAYSIDGIIIKTTDISYSDRWYKTSGNTVPTLKNAETVFKGQRLFIGAAISEYATKNKESKVSYDLEIINPHGKTVNSKKNLKGLDGKFSNSSYIQLTEEFNIYIFASQEAYGEYEIRLTLTDEINHSQKKLNSRFKLIPLPDYKSIEITENENFWDWMRNYYQKKQPESALAYYLFFTQTPLTSDKPKFFQIFYFFKEILQENPFLYVEFQKAYTESPDKSKYYLALLLYHSAGEAAFEKYMHDDELLDLVKNDAIPDPTAEITNPYQIDMLWASFAATGQQKPVQKIVSALSLGKYAGELQKMIDRNDADIKKNPNAFKDALFTATEISLESKIKSEVLVQNYVRWIYENIELDKYQKKSLDKILRKSVQIK